MPPQYARPFNEIQFLPERLNEPLHLRKPARIFVGSGTDLFHPNVSPDQIDAVFEVMAAATQHAFLILTKRPELIEEKLYGVTEACPCRELGGGDYLPNVWLGTSVEDQASYDERMRFLLKTVAALRWLSVEPTLGSINLGLAGVVPRTITPGYAHVGSMIGWCVVGGETGPGARPMDPDWARDLRDQCKQAGVPFFFKAMGGGRPIPPDLVVREYPRGD